MDLVKRAEGAEKRCDALQSNAKDMAQKIQDTEGRFRKVRLSQTRLVCGIHVCLPAAVNTLKDIDGRSFPKKPRRSRFFVRTRVL